MFIYCAHLKQFLPVESVKTQQLSFLILHPQKHRNIHTLGDLRVGSLEGSSSRNDLDQLASDDGLPGPVEGDRQLVDHLASVL